MCPGGNVCQPCGSKGKNPRRAQTLAGGRLGPCHQTKTGGQKKNQPTDLKPQRLVFSSALTHYEGSAAQTDAINV